MARKNIFENVMKGDANGINPNESSVGFTKFGAAKSISSSIDELARQASRLVEGQAVLEIDPQLIDGSFVSDRMDPEGDEFRALLEAIRDRGQDSPILVRPHPIQTGRFQIVFGHRRVRVAQELGRPVRAVVKPLEDIDHVLAQGQENSARANLSFIERVLFAERLLELGYTKEVIQGSLTIDYQTLSKMLTIPRAIPEAIVLAIGSAKGVGRDRWLELRKLIENPKNSELAANCVQEPDFLALNSNDRFDRLFDRLNQSETRKSIKKAIAPKAVRTWMPDDKSCTAKIREVGKVYSLSLRSKGHSEFGAYISKNLDRLYQAFKESEKLTKTGD
jgi:ParB family transcriptional regulator, chromosome partitioning protein